ncbi:cell envelope biogenesis protein OmpA [Streptomyces sp. P3]|uniref:cell envelope biogenesis protein OmpA n=1 Tax=Streptomyces sp. P3 TaxID=2135430 RepID=UPI0020B16540|nr:cell envelope biogenesis protein OmpA [Streptomyces sp. P3]
MMPTTANRRPAAARRLPLPDERGAGTATRKAPSRPAEPPSRAGADILRIVSDPRTPVFVTEHANGRRIYGYWRPLDAGSGRGGCYVALSRAECDALHAAGRITLGEPVADPAKTTYRVRPARTAPAAARTAPVPVRTPVGQVTRGLGVASAARCA